MFAADDEVTEAFHKGLEARLSLRARIILNHAEHGRMKLMPLAHERLIRIANEPKEEDRGFLGAFDSVLPG